MVETKIRKSREGEKGECERRREEREERIRSDQVGCDHDLTIMGRRTHY